MKVKRTLLELFRLAVQNGSHQVWWGKVIPTAVFSIFGAVAWTVRHR